MPMLGCWCYTQQPTGQNRTPFVASMSLLLLPNFPHHNTLAKNRKWKKVAQTSDTQPGRSWTLDLTIKRLGCTLDLLANFRCCITICYGSIIAKTCRGWARLYDHEHYNRIIIYYCCDNRNCLQKFISKCVGVSKFKVLNGGINRPRIHLKEWHPYEPK